MITIPITPIRKLIENLHGDEAALGMLNGIYMEERRDYRKDNFYRCADYVFNTIKGENMGCLTTNASFRKDPFSHLKDYKEVEEPQNGDVVAYNNGKMFTHFGIYRNGRVISKFGNGSVFEHRIELVSLNYGNEVRFYRKVNK